MKTIGIIGGMSWESTSLYYHWINREVASSLGGLNSAKVIVHSLNFSEIAALQRASEWEKLADILSKAAQKLEAAGADCILIATNTMHLIANEVQASISVPLIHIAEVTAEAILGENIQSIGLLGTKFTMEENFYADKLSERKIHTIIPDSEDRDFIHHVIFNELCVGQLSDESKARFIEIGEKLRARGAGGIVLGCTEIPMLIGQDDFDFPVFDTTYLHAIAAAQFSMR